MSDREHSDGEEEYDSTIPRDPEEIVEDEIDNDDGEGSIASLDQENHLLDENLVDEDEGIEGEDLFNDGFEGYNNAFTFHK